MVTKTKNGMRTKDVTFQIVENKDGGIQMWPKGSAAKKEFNGPINFSRVSGKSGNKAYEKLAAILEL
jgi:hypothetical protein